MANATGTMELVIRVCNYCRALRAIICCARVPGPQFALSKAEADMAEAINWSHDYDAAVKQASAANKLILLDFSAAPM